MWNHFSLHSFFILGGYTLCSALIVSHVSSSCLESWFLCLRWIMFLLTQQILPLFKATFHKLIDFPCIWNTAKIAICLYFVHESVDNTFKENLRQGKFWANLLQYRWFDLGPKILCTTVQLSCKIHEFLNSKNLIFTLQNSNPLAFPAILVGKTEIIKHHNSLQQALVSASFYWLNFHLEVVQVHFIDT